MLLCSNLRHPLTCPLSAGSSGAPSGLTSQLASVCPRAPASRAGGCSAASPWRDPGGFALGRSAGPPAPLGVPGAPQRHGSPRCVGRLDASFVAAVAEAAALSAARCSRSPLGKSCFAHGPDRPSGGSSPQCARATPRCSTPAAVSSMLTVDYRLVPTSRKFTVQPFGVAADIPGSTPSELEPANPRSLRTQSSWRRATVSPVGLVSSHVVRIVQP